VELQSGPFCDIFHALLSEDQAVLAAVRSLLRPSRRNRVAADVEEVED
jgi:hypothetical protein